MNNKNNTRQPVKDNKKAISKEKNRSASDISDVDFKSYLQGIAKTMNENIRSKAFF
jgi:hypothetical protein